MKIQQLRCPKCKELVGRCNHNPTLKQCLKEAKKCIKAT